METIMALAITAAFEEFVLEVEDDPLGAPGTFNTICGLTDVTINRTNTTDSTETPDCDDESLPFAITRGVRTTDITISGTGVWAATSNDFLLDWFYGGTTLNVRLRNVSAENNGASGEISAETWPMLLTNLSNSRTKGQTVTAEVSLERNGGTTFANVA